MHVVSNLLSNALKFTSPGGRIYVNVDTAMEEKKEVVKITVRDTGRGIPQEFVKKIFERFYQVPDKYDQTPGTGLGLALASELAKLMKGEIRVKSEADKGTEFTVVLPVQTSAKLSEDHGVPAIHSEAFDTIVPKAGINPASENFTENSGEKPLLLIVEDNIDVVEYLHSVLNKHYDIELASNGKAGLEKALEIIPDIILSDVMMPQMDGFEMLLRLKKDIRTDHIPVVILTARGDFDSKLTGLETGADHYLVKPFSEKELLLKLHNLLELRKNMQKQLGILPVKNHQGDPHFLQEKQFIEKINSLIDSRLDDEKFEITDICDSLNMSRAQLYRKFSALTNKSIGRYIRSYRLHKAKEILETSEKNVSEAAFETGFKNLSHFSTSFREEFGFPPGTLL
jgi:DNA-binding response OmpR family regulator/anti-sigma regulatory factor (Ser/Thr protein kinase)